MKRENIRPWQSRTAQLYGTELVEKLQNCHVLVVGLGGVGSWAAEALVRTGLGKITLVDPDVVEESNINRQLPALHSTLGNFKVEVLATRFRQINPQLDLLALPQAYTPGDGPFFCEQAHGRPDYILDCIDNLNAKADLIRYAAENALPLVSAGGCARRLDPRALEFKDIYATSGDPLLRNLRRSLRKAGVAKLLVLSSHEPPQPIEGRADRGPASAIFVPASCGLELARCLINDLLGDKKIPAPTLQSEQV